MDMKSLTRVQRRQIAAYLHFRGKPMSILGLFWFNRRIHATLLLVGVLSALVAYWLNDFFLLMFVAVAYPTIFLRDAGHYWRSKRVWPVVQEVLAWDKLQQLATGVNIVA
jgi:hypothetical protein